MKRGLVYMKKAIGIISIVLFFVVGFQSCAAGLGNALSNNGEVSGSAGIILGISMLIAGIITLVSKESKGLTITAIVFYILGGILGFANAGTFSDLKIWAAMDLIFAACLAIQMVKKSKAKN